ncbi:MAG TPA: alpha/beta fold hydrolase [Ignavibacteria bacterium]|nr:alpha/beta fold hydrolase [Ignavibacteria bacterium]HMQ98844.1 alpha/beta fold hydrolase [Ignavibacteria bacterium]
MRSARFTILAVVVIILFTGLSSSQQKRARDSYEFLKLLPKYSNSDALPVTRVDFTVTLRDGTILDALKFIPQGTPPAGGWPTVVFVHGYGDNKETLAGFAAAQAEYGYYTTTFSMRGQGHSTGLSNLISTTEAQDMIEFIDFIKQDTKSGINPNNILVMGGSQGGLVPFMACTMGMNVRTIISALAPPNFASSWIENGCIKMTLLWTVEYTPDTARYTPQVARMSDWIYASAKQYWDSLAFYLPQNRDFMTGIADNRVPLIMEGSWQDKFFNASGIMKASELNTGSTLRLYLGAVQGHGGDNSPTEDTWHMQFFNDWFYYWLFPYNGTKLPQANFDYASTQYPVNGLYWSFKHDSSKVALQNITTPYRLYFNTNNRLTTTAGTNNSRRVSIRNRVTGGLTMQEAVNEEFTGTTFTSKFKKNSVSFTSAALTSDKKWLGTPKVNLDYLSTASTFTQYNFQVLEVMPNGKEKLINRINYTDRNYTASSRRTKNFEGQAHSHIFKTGNKIKIIITNLDTHADDAWFLGTNPFVLPVLNNGYNYVYLNNNSYIDLPLVNAVNEISDNTGVNSPYTFSLSQNYPNPFNPVTMINYSIPQKGLVTIKVYDVTGKLVKTLVNETMEAGSSSVLFDASSLSSGVYFYNIVSGSYTDTKKMILVK